jgi:hypothetical protein
MSMEPTGSPGDDAAALVGAGEDTGDGAFDLSMAVAQLASNSTDSRIMLKLLVSQLADALGNDSLEADLQGASVRCSIGHSSGGIRIRSEQVDMNTWLTRLLSILQSEAAHSEQTRVALENIVIGGPS